MTDTAKGSMEHEASILWTHTPLDKRLNILRILAELLRREGLRLGGKNDAS